MAFVCWQIVTRSESRSNVRFYDGLTRLDTRTFVELSMRKKGWRIHEHEHMQHALRNTAITPLFTISLCCLSMSIGGVSNARRTLDRTNCAGHRGGRNAAAARRYKFISFIYHHRHRRRRRAHNRNRKPLCGWLSFSFYCLRAVRVPEIRRPDNH